MPSYMRCGCNQPGGRTGSRLIVLDNTNSILNPPAGTCQRFCYQIFAEDAQGNVYVPLEYVVLGLGQNIGKKDFNDLTVSINGVRQNVVWGQNAWVLSANDPDHVTGCAGLKLMFPLNNATDVMTVCMTMKRVYTSGMVNGCLNANGEAFTGLSVVGPLASEGEACPSTAYQEVDVCLPVTITPYATVGDAAVTCCGAPTITQGGDTCTGTVGGQCTFTISQRMCVALPVTFGANTQAGEYSVACGNAGEGECQSCSLGDAAVAAARNAVANGMIHMNGAAAAMPANIRQSCGCIRCRQINQQTRIQDLIRDPMIWKD